jgi:O-acetyl-ADP-ribose deacetylase (regulator of RNase III)
MMTDPQALKEVRFGRTVVAAAAGRTTDYPVQAIVFAANTRGLMGAGAAGALPLSIGPEVERDAMARAPHELGTAFRTGAGNLASRGVGAVIHAVIATTLGDPPQIPVVRRAVTAALRVADEARCRSIALPLLGLPADADLPEQTTLIEAIVDETVAYLRRAQTRLEWILIVSGLLDDAALIEAAIRRARERSWVARP